MNPHPECPSDRRAATSRLGRSILVLLIRRRTTAPNGASLGPKSLRPRLKVFHEPVEAPVPAGIVRLAGGAVRNPLVMDGHLRALRDRFEADGDALARAIRGDGLDAPRVDE